MAGLKSAPPLVSSLPGNGKFAPDAEKSRDQKRSAAQPWRNWYKLKRWRDLRLEVFKRDNYRCRRTGEFCGGKHPDRNSPVANHIMPHRGDPILFWDINNLETVSKETHDSLIQKEEQSIPHGQWY